jgi:D-cysteine desulfhydrase family pyridoxal phosphate-dependent enzyme
MLQRRLSLIFTPTPVHFLERASKQLGAEIWIKRDDLTGFAASGNKGRKLEYLIADAIEAGADTVVTCGAWQSNFIRQCTAACNVYGLEFHAVAMHWPYPAVGRETRPHDWTPYTEVTSNELLNQWLGGAVVRLIEDGTWDELEQAADDLATQLSAQGKRVYRIPAGGSTGVGALGFVRAAGELLTQSLDFDRIIVACGSGSTQAGLVYGLRQSNVATAVIGICTDNEPELLDQMERIGEELDELLGAKLRLTRDDFDLRLEFAGRGYQSQTPESQEAISFLAKSEAIFLDPIYTGKAFAGLINLALKSELPGRTLFWHTGGFPGLFTPGYAPRL